MAVKLLESLEMQTGLPLDSRYIVTNIDQRNNISPTIRYIGMEVYVTEENKKYRLENGIENFNWVCKDIDVYTKSEIDNKRIETSNGVIGGNTLGEGVNIQLDFATEDEVISALNENLIKDIFVLAEAQDIRNLFVGTRLEGGTSYNLSSLDPDETKIVNMKLLSLYNDLVLQKVDANDTKLKNDITSLINSVKSALQSDINTKETKTEVARLISSLRTELTQLINTNSSDTTKKINDLDSKIDTQVIELNKKIDDKESKTNVSSQISSLRTELNDAINQKETALKNSKADKTIKINAGTAITGGGTLANDITIGIDFGTDEDITSIMTENYLKQIFELATENDVKNLFVNTSLEGETTYNLSALSPDETKMVNMKLLSLFNDLVIQKVTGLMDSKDNALSNTLKSLINSKVNSSTTVQAGTGLTGGGALTSNVTLSLEYGSDTDIINILK